MKKYWVTALVIGALTVAIVAVIIVTATSDKSHTKHSKKPGQPCDFDLCLTEECIHTASRTLASMDQTVDPCDSFYQYACGGFLKTTKIPEDDSTVDAYNLLGDEISEQLNKVLQEPIKEQDSKSVRLAKDLYAACLNAEVIEERGVTPIQDILKELGGWPVLEGDAWNETDFDWMVTTSKLRGLGLPFNQIISVAVSADTRNNTVHVLELDQPSLGMHRDQLLKGLEDERVYAYYQYQKDMAKILGADEDRASQDLLEALVFETFLANISMSAEERRNMSNLINPMSVRKLQSTYPSIPWLEFINSIMPEDAQVKEIDDIIVVDVKYFSELEDLLAVTDKRVVANYLLWGVLMTLVDVGPQSFAEAQLKYSIVISGITAASPSWEICVQHTYDELPVAASAMYVKMFFQKEAKRTVMEIVNEIQDAFIEIVRKVDWMDENTKERAINKTRNMITYIAYPDELLDDDKVDAYYKNLYVNRTLFLESTLNITKFDTDLEFSQLHQPVNKTDWSKHSYVTEVNAYNLPDENSIELPAGILQGVFFNPKRPMYMNFGRIGFTMGHEVTHGFDDEGRQYDEVGNLVNWWKPDTEAKFLEKAQCIIDQYGNFTEPMTGLKVNGITTQGENIADNGGLKQAYLGYLRWSQKQAKSEPRLPGLEWLSPQQMLWLSAAQDWCTKYRREYLVDLLSTDSHAPAQFRADGPFSNTEEFARDFQCPLGSRMNPAHKCTVW